MCVCVRERERERERTASGYFRYSAKLMRLCTAVKEKQRMCLKQEVLNSSSGFLICLAVLQSQSHKQHSNNIKLEACELWHDYNSMQCDVLWCPPRLDSKSFYCLTH